MYSIRPPEVVILDRVKNDPAMSARLDRMLEHIDSPLVQVVDDAGLAEIAADRGWNVGGKRTGQYHTDEAPAIIFNAFRFDADEEIRALSEKYPALRAHRLLGINPWGFRDHKQLRETQDCICQSAWEFHCAFGCLHACQYCHITPIFNIMMNVEEIAARMRAFGETIPEQKLYKFDNATDQITLEPEYGASQIMVEMFADWPGRYLLLYTKSDNVDHLLGLRHNGHTLISWSLGSETACREVETKTPSLDQRLAAMEKCQAAGYTVRARISPMAPLKNWKDEYRDLVERLLARVTPDIISVDVIGWMDARQMKDGLDMDLFHPDYVAALDRREAEGFKRLGKHLFPHAMRADMLRYVIKQIQRVSPDQPVSLCMEEAGMWRELGPLTGMTPGHYACCCGPTSVPGHPLLRA